MMSPKVSIIIPIYNVDKELLEKCVQSVLTQTCGNFELILVDDGSTDGSGALCDAFAEKDPRIQVIHQENQGVSAARNNGTACAGGEYVMYVDGDDLLAPYALEEGLAAAEDTGADMVMAGIVKIKQVEEFHKYIDAASGEYVLYEKDAFDIFRRHYVAAADELRGIKGNGYVNRGPVSRLIVAEAAKKTFFPRGLPIGEDVLWNMALLNVCEKVCVVKNIWYAYLVHGPTAIRKYYGNREQVASLYLTRLLEENPSFFKTHMREYARNVAVEFYCILNYELLSDKCKVRNAEKRKLVRMYIAQEPWNILRNKEMSRMLPLSYKLLFSQCSSGLWLELLMMKKAISKFR